MHIISAKRSLFPLINLKEISLSWIAFEESNIWISSRTCSFETKLKENVGVFSCSEVHKKQLSKYLSGAILKNICSENICKLLSKYMWQSLFLVKSYAFNIFSWTPLDGCICIMKIVLWEASYFRRQNNIETKKALLWKLSDIKNESCKRYLGNKEQKAMFYFDRTCNLVLSIPFLRARLGAQVKLEKIGRLERYLSTHASTWVLHKLFFQKILKLHQRYHLIRVNLIKNQMSNFRPVSVLNTFSKVYEKTK